MGYSFQGGFEAIPQEKDVGRTKGRNGAILIRTSLRNKIVL